MSNVSIFVAHEGCPCRCAFCNQHIIAGQSARVSAQDVKQTLETALESEHHRDNQIAFFGGSFTAIEREYMIELLEATVPYREAFDGIRISTRPDAIDDEVLRILHHYGVKAIELGAQSMDDEVLRLNCRGHSAEDVRRAARLIRDAGFELGVQMMTGLYGDSDDKALATAESLIALQPATVRIYPTVVLKGTELERLYREGKFVPQSLEQAIALCVRLTALFEAAGVNIIRLGLHDSELLAGSRVAGAYHPAFRELCLSRMYFNKVREALEGRPRGSYTVTVGSKYLSQMIGQNRENIGKLHSAGYDIRVKTDSALKKYEITITE